MWTIARARAAGVLLALAVLLVPWSSASGSPLAGAATPGTAHAAATAAALAAGHGVADHHPDASGTQPDAGQLTLVRQAARAGALLERRLDRPGHGLAALLPATLAAAILLGLEVGWRARRRTGRSGDRRRGSRAPPQLLTA
jgi:hypothetical protein